MDCACILHEHARFILKNTNVVIAEAWKSEFASQTSYGLYMFCTKQTIIGVHLMTQLISTCFSWHIYDVDMGVTQVDTIRTVTLPLLKHFGIEEGVEFKVARPF